MSLEEITFTLIWINKTSQIIPSLAPTPLQRQQSANKEALSAKVTLFLAE